MKFLLTLLLTILPYHLFGCANAHLFKIFPVGVCGDTIVSVDVDISRNTMSFAEFKGNIDFESNDRVGGFDEISYQIRTYISKYDKHQHLIETIPLDSTSLGKVDYLKELQILYKKGVDKITDENKNIELFTPSELWYCKFDGKCKNLEVKDDHVIYEKKIYSLPVLNELKYFGLKHFVSYFEIEDKMPLLPSVGTIRKFSTPSIELIVFHTQAGQILNDAFYKKFSAPFANLETAVYEEPILYHGQGIDLFIVKELN